MRKTSWEASVLDRRVFLGFLAASSLMVVVGFGNLLMICRGTAIWPSGAITGLGVFLCVALIAAWCLALPRKLWYMLPLLALYSLVALYHIASAHWLNQQSYALQSVAIPAGYVEITWYLAVITSCIIWVLACGLGLRCTYQHLSCIGVRGRALAIIIVSICTWCIFAPLAVSMSFPRMRVLSELSKDVYGDLRFWMMFGFSTGLLVVLSLCVSLVGPRTSARHVLDTITRQSHLMLAGIVVMVAGMARSTYAAKIALSNGNNTEFVVDAARTELAVTGVYYSLMLLAAYAPCAVVTRMAAGRLAHETDTEVELRPLLKKQSLGESTNVLVGQAFGVLLPLLMSIMGGFGL